MKEKAMELYDEMVAKSKQSYVSPTLLATVNAALGFDDNAIDFANQAYENHDPLLPIGSRYLPDSLALRSLSGFNEILKRMKLID